MAGSSRAHSLVICPRSLAVGVAEMSSACFLLSHGVARFSAAARPLPVLASNQRVLRSGIVQSRILAGISLVTSELKSLVRHGGGRCDLSGASIVFRDSGVFLVGAHIAETAALLPYHFHEATRDRQLLLTKQEIKRLRTQAQSAGSEGSACLDVVPLRLMQVSGKFSPRRTFIKLELGVVCRDQPIDDREKIRDKQWTKTRLSILRGASDD